MAKAKNDAATVKPTDMGATPVPKADLKGLNENDAIEIVHPDTGQTYGVSVKAYHDLYEPLGYVPTRMADSSLLPGDERAATDVPANQPAPVLPQPADTAEQES
jgi:hypothetical protein